MRNKSEVFMEKQIKKKLSFASADIFGGGSFNIINFLYPGFLAFIVGLSAFHIGAILLIVRIWDAITDPLMGYISDRTSSKFGKRRVYLIFVSPFILLSFYLLFFPYNFSLVGMRFVFVLLSYILFTTFQTMVMIPYYSLSSEISSDYQNRASYNSYRLGFSIFSSIICVAVPGIIVGLFSNEKIGYQVMSLMFGFIFMVAIFITGVFAKEEIVTPPTKNRFSFKKLMEPLRLKVFRQYLFLYLMVQVSMVVMAGLFFFYVDFYITKDITASGETSVIGLIAAALMFFMQIVALPVYLKLIDKKGKTNAYRIGAYIWIFMALFLFVIPANSDPLYIILLAALIGFGISGPGLVPHTMLGDIADVGELVYKERLDGQMSGFTNFVTKISQAIGISFAMFLIGLAGFIEKEYDGPDILVQPDSATLMIKLILVLTPLIFMTIGIIVSFKYKLDKNKQHQVKEAISSDDLKEEALRGLI